MESEGQSSNPWAAETQAHNLQNDSVDSNEITAPAQDGQKTTQTSRITAPPAYSSSLGPNPRSQLLSAMSQMQLLQRVDPTAYTTEGATLSKDKTIMSIRDAELASNPKRLKEFIVQQMSLPPKPVVRILGWHKSFEQLRVIDFDISINVMPLIIRPNGNEWNYTIFSQLVDGIPKPQGSVDSKDSSGTGDLDTSIRDFCSDTAPKKTFTIERRVTNWDTGYIDGQLHGLLHNLCYKGEFMFVYPIQHSKVVVHSVKSEEARKKAGFFDFLKEKVNFLPPKDYAAAQVVWPYASDPAHSECDDQVRKCAVQSEQAWWNSWKKAISNCILTRRIGWASLEDQLEAQMGFEPHQPQGHLLSSGWGKNGDRALLTQSEF